MIMKYNIVVQPYYITGEPMHTMAVLPIYINYCLKRRHFVARYVPPSMDQQLFKKNFCNQSSHYENYGQFPL